MDKDLGSTRSGRPENDSTLADVVDSHRDLPGRIGRRVVLSLVAVFIVVALADVFGLTSRATSTSPGYTLTVTSPASIRAGMDARITVELHSEQKISAPITMEVEQDYLDAFSTYSTSPVPDGESSDGTSLVLDYDAPGETAFRLDIDGTASEDALVLARGEVRVYVDGKLVATTELKTWKVL